MIDWKKHLNIKAKPEVPGIVGVPCDCTCYSCQAAAVHTYLASTYSHVNSDQLPTDKDINDHTVWMMLNISPMAAIALEKNKDDFLKDMAERYEMLHLQMDADLEQIESGKAHV